MELKTAIKKVNATDGVCKEPDMQVLYPRQWMSEEAALSVRIASYNKIGEGRREQLKEQQEEYNTFQDKCDEARDSSAKVMDLRRDADFLDGCLQELINGNEHPAVLQASTRIKDAMSWIAQDYERKFLLEEQSMLKARMSLNQKEDRLDKDLREGTEKMLLTEEMEKYEAKIEKIRERLYEAVESTLRHPRMSVEDAIVADHGTFHRFAHPELYLLPPPRLETRSELALPKKMYDF